MADVNKVPGVTVAAAPPATQSATSVAATVRPPARTTEVVAPSRWPRHRDRRALTSPRAARVDRRAPVFANVPRRNLPLGCLVLRPRPSDHGLTRANHRERNYS